MSKRDTEAEAEAATAPATDEAGPTAEIPAEMQAMADQVQAAADRAEVAADKADVAAQDASAGAERATRAAAAPAPVAPPAPPPFVDIYSAGSDAVKVALAELRAAKGIASDAAQHAVKMDSMAAEARSNVDTARENVTDADAKVVETMRHQIGVLQNYPGVSYPGVSAPE